VDSQTQWPGCLGHVLLCMLDNNSARSNRKDLYECTQWEGSVLATCYYGGCAAVGGAIYSWHSVAVCRDNSILLNDCGWNKSIDRPTIDTVGRVPIPWAGHFQS